MIMTRGENGGRKSDMLPPPPPSLLRDVIRTTGRGRSLTPPLPPPPHSTKVTLIQNRLIDKINRSHSDLTHDSYQRTTSQRTSRTAVSASRLIHSVRRSASSQQLVRNQSPSVERLISSPDLQSPLVVKRAMGNVIRHKGANGSSAHKIQVKLEVSGPGKSGSSGASTSTDSVRKSKEILTLKSREGSKKSEKKSSSKSSSKLPKSVKISNTVSVKNGESSNIPLNSSSNGNSDAAVSSNGSNQPVKPPRKSKSSSSKSEKSSKKSSTATNGSTLPSCGSRHTGGVTPTRSESPKPSKIKTPSRSTSRSPTPTGSSKTSPSTGSRIIQRSFGKGLSVSKTLTDGLSKIISSKSSTANKLKNGTGGKVTKETLKKGQSPEAVQKCPATTQSSTIHATNSSKMPQSGIEGYKGIRKTPSTIVTITQKPLAPPAEIKPIRVNLPLLKRIRHTVVLPKGFRLFTLNPIFLTRSRARSPSPGPMGFPRPTKTSLMREIIARDPISFKDSTIKHISDSTGTLTTLKSADGSTGAATATSVLDLGFKPRQRRRRSVSCLNLKDYTQYILQLRHSYRNRSPRFSQLHRLYSSLDRLYQLERSTASLYDVSPVLSNAKRNDFDAWWKVRNRLRIEQEMAMISRQLLQAQSDREFFFKPKLLEQFRWTADFDTHLRFKKWNVEELKSFLLTGEMPRGRTQAQADLYKTQWRGMSVKELALNLEVNDLVKRQQGGNGRQDEVFYENRIPLLRRAFSMSSTLSEEQREGIKRRIGNLIEASKTDGCDLGSLSGRSSRASQRVQTSRMGFTLSSDRREITGSSGSVGGGGGMTESAKKEISRNISEEFKERRVKETNLLRDSFKTSSQATTTALPISTKIALRKAESVREKRTTSSPFYSVYCKDGVNNRIAVFEKRGGNDEKNVNFVDAVGKGSGGIITDKVRKPLVKVQIVTPTPAPTAKVTKARVTKTSDYVKPPQSEGPASLPVIRSTSPLRRTPSPIRPRSPIRRSVSPEHLGKDYVSHVNIISKLASLLLKRNTSLKNLVTREVLERDKLERLRSLNCGEVERLRDYFESYEDFYGIKSPEINLLRCLFCSDSNLAKITEKLDSDHKRRCASAMDLEENEKQQHQQRRNALNKGQNRSAPDGSSPTPGGRSGGTSPALYLNTRSRKPIYQPSSTPNVCQPTLTAHCYLQPSESLERVESPMHYEVNYDSLPHSFSSPAPSSLSSYYGSGAVPPRRILDERLVATSPNQVITNTWNTNQAPDVKGYSYTNYDPAAHQPRYRYIPQPPVIPVMQMPQVGKHDYRSGSALGLPHVQYFHDDRGLRRSESFHSTALPSRQRGRVMSPPPPRGGYVSHHHPQQWNNQRGPGNKWRNAEADPPRPVGVVTKQESNYARISSLKRSSRVKVIPQETAV